MVGVGRRRAMASPPISPVVSFFFLFFLSIICFSFLFVSADKFTVGDSKGWNPGVNYTIWEEKHRPFHVGDWLVFYYQSGMADVVQVDAVAYNKCDAANPISNYSKGRSYAFELNESKRYYFICSYGYCYGGMKVSVLAQPPPPPSPPPHSHSDSHASPLLLLRRRRGLRLLFLFSIAAAVAAATATSLLL